MIEKDLICYADHCSGTLAGSRTRLNPYKLGLELYRDIEDRWNRGCFGEEYQNCDDYEERQHWNTHAGKGREKIFEVRRIHNDLTFVDEFLTYDFCRQHKLFQFGFNEGSGYYEIESRQFEEVKKALLFNLTNMTGNPEAIFEVVQLPTGEIIDAVLRKSSGVRAYDEAVQRAIQKSSPLPRPDRPELFQRSLTLKFRPQD